MLATYSGEVGAGSTDATDFFKLGGALDGADFTAKFFYDTTLGDLTQFPWYDSLVGGPFFGGATSPILAASLTINGVTDAFDVAQDGAINVFSLPGFAQTFGYTGYFSGPGLDSVFDSLQLFVLNAPNPVTLDTDYTGTNLPVSTLDPLATNFAVRSQLAGGALTVSYRLNLDPERVTLSHVLKSAAVPEPSVWSSLVLGFLTCGAMLRARRRVLVAAPTA
jgi:hypothetical protein